MCTINKKRKFPYRNRFKVSVLKIKVVGLDELKFVNNCIKQQLTNALQLLNANNTLHIIDNKHSDKNKKTLKNVKNVEKNLKNDCERLIKNFAKICHQSNYYLHTLSHVACQILTLILMSPNLCDVSALQQVSRIF